MMKNARRIYFARNGVALLALLFVFPGAANAAKLQSATLKSWETYIELTEKRIGQELSSTSNFLRTDFMDASDTAKVRGLLQAGQVHISRTSTKNKDGREIKVSDGLIHHWFGSIFVPNTTLQSVISWVQDYDQHYRHFKEVEGSKLVSREGDTFKMFLRFVRKKVVTVRYNTDHTVIYQHHGDGRQSSRSFTTRIAEIKDAGTASETEKPVGDDSGYLWRLNSYWRFLQHDGGVVIECESVSLSRSIPFGLGWLIKGFVESVPRESLESTLVGIRDGLAGRGE